MPKPRDRSELTVPSRTEALARVREFVRAQALRSGFSEDQVDQIVIAVDEACTNIIKHAYGGDASQRIRIRVEAHSDRLEIVLLDRGKMFDEAAYQEPDLAALIRTGHRGGLGLMLMRRLMDAVRYEHRNGTNMVRLIKYHRCTPP
ncbi:MAG: ATP-binding protein [Bacteroidota bacterium]|nr:ATP-binding protein [Bacteroidota bacterium]